MEGETITEKKAARARDAEMCPTLSKILEYVTFASQVPPQYKAAPKFVNTAKTKSHITTLRDLKGDEDPW